MFLLWGQSEPSILLVYIYTHKNECTHLFDFNLMLDFIHPPKKYYVSQTQKPPPPKKKRFFQLGVTQNPATGVT